MILVILGHTPSLNPLFRLFIYSFHMPLFFFLSGYVFQPEKYPHYGKFVVRRLQTMVLPYFCFYLLNYLGWLLFRFHTITWKTATFPLLNLLHPIRGYSYSTEGALWFLLALFFAEQIFYLIHKYVRNASAVVGSLLLCAALGYLYALSNKPFPWSIDAAFIAVVFYGAGYYGKKLQVFRPIKYGNWLVVAAMVINLRVGYLNAGMNMWRNQYGDLLMCFIAAFAGIYYFIRVTQRIKPFPLLATIGKNNLVLLALQTTIIFPLLDLTPMHALFAFHQVGFLYCYAQTVCTLAILLPLSLFIQRYLPFMLGQPYRKQLPHATRERVTFTADRITGTLARYLRTFARGRVYDSDAMSD